MEATLETYRAAIAATGPKACGILSFQRPSVTGSRPGSCPGQGFSSHPTRPSSSRGISAEVSCQVSRLFSCPVSRGVSPFFSPGFSSRVCPSCPEPFSRGFSAGFSPSFSPGFPAGGCAVFCGRISGGGSRESDSGCRVVYLGHKNMSRGAGDPSDGLAMTCIFAGVQERGFRVHAS